MYSLYTSYWTSIYITSENFTLAYFQFFCFFFFHKSKHKILLMLYVKTIYKKTLLIPAGIYKKFQKKYLTKAVKSFCVWKYYSWKKLKAIDSLLFWAVKKESSATNFYGCKSYSDAICSFQWPIFFI